MNKCINIVRFFVVMIISFLFLTCDPGLGKAVDTQAPTVAVEFPVTKSVLKGGFVMKGIASDEVKVTGCKVTFKNMSTSDEYTYNASVTNGEFTVSINSPNIELPDGDYNVTVTALDAYHAASADVVYTIDNTAPTVLLTSPNSYSVSNWPNMYKTFSIKGEVYDRSNLESVTVYLVDETGEVLKSVIADGTNTFLASFDTPFEEEKTCYYYAVARDAGGNENSYCYHKSDIFQLLSSSKNNQSVGKGDSVVFPSINTIGYVDQGQTTNLTEKLSREDLVAKKIENNGAKKVEGKIVFPGFNYFKDNAAQIKWLNISNDVSKVAGIAIGSPVLGTIMPPTDGSAINYSTVKVWVAKIPGDFKDENEHNTPEDFKKYLNENLFTSENELETCVVSEGESGDKQVKLTAVGESLNFQVDCNKPGDDESYWPSGFYYVKVEFTTESGVTSYDFCKFEVTSGAPVLTEGNFSKGNEKASYYRGYVTSNSIQEGFAGKALTSDENSPVEIDWSYIGTTVAGEEVKSEVTRIQPAIDGAYTIDINHEQDGEYTYTLTAAPDSDLSTVISRVVVVDTTKPVITYSTLVEGEIKESTEISVKGNVDDANGIEKVEYQLMAGSTQILVDGTQGTGWQEIPKAKSSFNLTLSNLKENITYTVKIRATDVAGNVSEDEKYKCNFTIDLSNPVASIDVPKPEENSSIVFVNSIPNFSGKANDGAVTEGKLASTATLSFSKDGGSASQVSAGSAEGQFNWNQSLGTWTWTPTSSQFNGIGKYDVTLKVTDNAGKTTTVTRTVSLDTSIPTIKLTQVSNYVDKDDDGYYVNGDISVKFDITENDYIKEIKFYHPDGTEDGQDLGTNAQPSVKIDTTKFDDGITLGEFKLVVTDRSGNQGVYTGEDLSSYEINQDSDTPIIVITGINESITSEDGISQGNNLLSTNDTITITLKDDDGLASGTYQIDTNDVKAINVVDSKVKTETISLNSLQQGPHTIKLSVKDIYGKEVTKGIFYFGIDDESPKLIIDGYSETNIDAGFKNTNFDITGTANDSYEFGQLIWNYDGIEETTKIERDGSGSWILNVSKPDSSQKKTIKFVATDKFLRTTVKTFTYAFDLDKPNLVISPEQKSSITNKYFNQNTMVTLSGTANDVTGESSTQSGLKVVQYGLGAGHNAENTNTLEYSNTNGSAEWTVLLNVPGCSDGPYTLFVKAIDNSENESDVQKFNITADSTSPVLTEGGNTDASGTSYTSGDLHLAGTVSDVNLSKVTYVYSFNGVEDEPVELEVVGTGSEKTWIVTKLAESLKDGTHVIKVVATDKAGNSSVITRNIILDTTAPVITTNVSPQIMYDNGSGKEVTVNGTINVDVRIAEINKLQGVYYTFEEGDDWTYAFTDDELSTGKIIEVNTRDFDDGKKLPLRIKAVDEAGNFSVVSVSPVINQKSDWPSLTPSNFVELDNENEAGYSEESAKNVFNSSNPNMIFTLSDDDKISSYQVSLNGGDSYGNPIKVESSQQTITYSLMTLLENDSQYKRHTIKFKVMDENYKDDSSTPNNFVYKTYYIAIDDGVPVITISTANNQFVNSVEILGNVSDKNGVKKITFTPKGCAENEVTPDDKGNFSYKLEENLSGKSPIKVRAIDGIGYVTETEFVYKVDTTKPTVSVNSSVAGKVWNQTTSLEVQGTANDLAATGEDSSGVAKVRYAIGKGHSATEVDSNGWKDASGTDTWSAYVNIPSYSDGAYTLFVQVFDNTSNESDVQKFNITADSKSPVLTEGDSTDANSTRYSQSTLNLTGTVTDDNLSELYYTYSFGENSVTEEPSISDDNNWVINKSNLADGTHIFNIVATDKAGNSSVITRNIIVDNIAPVITTNVSPQIMYNDGTGEKLTVNGTIDVNVRVTETNKLKGVYYTENTTLADDAEWSGDTGVTSFNETELSTGKTISVDTTRFADKSTLPLRIKAVDEAGNYSVVYVNPVINQESDKPSLTPSNFVELNDELNDENEKLAGWLGGNPTNVFSSSNPNMIFTLSDDDSVKEYSVKVGSGDFVKISEVNSTQKIVTYSLEDLIKNGNYDRHTITFRVKDVNCAENLSTQNNFVDKTYYIAIDDGQPSLIINNANNQYVGESFFINGSVTDKNGISSVIIKPLSGGEAYATLKEENGGLTKTAEGYSFKSLFTVPSTKDTIQILAIDSIGNESVKELTYLVDETKPRVLISNGEKAFIDGDSPTLRITGSAVDGDLGSNDNGISGIDQVRLKIGSQITGVNDEDSVLASGKIEDGVMSWSYNLDFTGKTAGTYTVYVRAFDHAGNKSEEKTITVYVDTNVPQLSHDYADNFVGVFKDNFVISGTATDASGVKSVTAKIQGDSGELLGTFTPTADDTPASWSFTVPADTGNGKLTILVTAKDGCGKDVQETFTATLDTVAPEVTFTDIADDDGKPETIETSKTNDKPSVAVTYSDITSGVKTLAYEFYYFDRTKGKFVNYATEDPNASGTFTRGSSYSGSVKLRMAEQTTVDSGAFIYPDTYTDGKWYVKVTVTDEAGNEATYNSPYFYVDQHKPTLDVTSPADLSLKKQNDALTVSGSTSDNFNGEIDKVVVKVTHPNYNQSQLEQFTKTFTKDGSNGTRLLTQIGSDEKYSFEYTWDESNSPFKFPNEYEVSILTYDKAGNETPVTRKVSCDSTAPTISFSRPYSYSVDAYGNVTKGSVVNSPIGDTSIKALANDYSMDSIYYQVGGTVEIESTGTLGQSDYKIKKLTVTDGGVGTDDYGTSYTNPSSDNLAAGVLVGVWNKLTVANFDFDVSYNTLTFNNSEKTYHVDGDKETIMTLDVHFVAVDEAGNVNYCKMPIKVDTDTDKPNLLILSPQTINDVANVGGTATISGTVNDDNSVHSVWMQVELVNGNYQDSVLSGTGISYLGSDYVSNPQYLVDNNDGTYSIGDTDTYFTDKSKWYKVNLGAENSKSTTWNMVLNKNKEFDNKSLYDNGYLSSEVAQTELIVRVRALDTKSGNSNVSSDAKLGDVSEFTLKIDSGSPSIIINNIGDFPTEGSYIGGDLVFDVDFSDDDSITEWKIEALSAASGDNRSLTIGYDKYSDSFEDGLGKTISVKETVDTEAIYRACGNVIQIKISAKDNSKNSNSDLPDEKETYLTFKYVIDNSAPQANYVDDTYRISTESVDGSDIRESEARNSHLRILSDQAAFIGNVKDEDNGSGVDYVMLYFTKDGYLYNPSQNNVKESLSNKVYLHDENGNQVEVDFPVSSLNDIARAPSSNGGKVTPYIVIDRAEGMNDSGSNGDLDGYDENLKANGDWVVYIKSSNLPDGVYDIHYVIVDQAKNARYYHDSMFVQNNAPKITSIVLATDIDGDEDASIGSADKGDEYEKFSGNYETTGFKVRNNKLKVKVNVTGGTGTLKYFLTYPTKNGSITTDSNNNGYKTGVFDVTEFKGDDGGNYVDYVVWVEDSVEEQLSLSSGKTTIDMIMDNVDDINPVAQFFELNTIVENSSVSNSNRGSLYKDGSVKGHIETRQNSPVDNDSEQDPDVSGTIILRGEVLDNQRIKSIVLRLNNTNVTIAEWNPNLSLLELKDANAKIYDSLGLLGHYVEWQYAWDTNSFAKYDTDVKVIVTDSAGKVSGNKDYSSDNTPRTESNKFTLDNWGYNSMTVDVVPYITGLGTTLSRIEKRNPSVYGRSTLGKYPVYYYRKTVSEGKESEEITVEGFNILSDSTVTFEGGATTSLDVNKVFTLPENAKSGKIFVTVSEVPSLNNVNKNDAEGSSGEYYNQKPNGQNNDLLTDDIELLIWEINSKAAIAESGELSEVMMHVNPSNGMLGFAFAHSQDLASYPNGNNNSYETWITDWTGVNQISFAYDKNGNMFGTNGGTDTYTPNKKVGRLGLISSHWGVITNTSASNDWYSGYTKYRRLRLEYLGLLRNNAYASNVYRFAKGDAIQLATTYSETSGTNLYMLYYDNTLGELKFKAGNFDSHEGAIYNSASGDKWTKSDLFFGDFSDDAHYEKASDSSNNYEPTYKTISIVANQNGANGDSYVRPGIYYSVDAISSSDGQSDVVVAVWYDDVNKTLWYSYLVNPLANAGKRDANGAISTEWATPIAILDGHAGGYCAIKVDDAGGIHIAAYSRNDAGSLYYAYLNSYDADYNENENLVAVDAYGSTGQYITMEVAKDGKGKYIPYIGYYMSSMSYPKYAYLVDTESAKVGGTYYPKPGVDENSMFTGAWETVLLPTTSTIVIDDINIGVYKNSDGTLKSIPKRTETESVGVKNGIAGGNDTSNPIFAYGISQTGSGYIETAQLK